MTFECLLNLEPITGGLINRMDKVYNRDIHTHTQLKDYYKDKRTAVRNLNQ